MAEPVQEIDKTYSHHIVNYDNFDQHIEDIKKNATLIQVDKGIWKSIVLIIYSIKHLYIDINPEMTWFKPITEKKDFLQDRARKLAYHPDFQIPKTSLYYIFFTCHVWIALMQIIESGLDTIFSDRSVPKEIKDHSNFKKGREHCTMMLKIIKQMIKHISIPLSCNKDFDSKTVLENSQFNKIYFYISQQNKSIIDDIPEEQRVQYAKKLNNRMYVYLLDMLTPCNFFTLLLSLSEFHKKLQLNRYINKLVNNYENPTYIPYSFKE